MKINELNLVQKRESTWYRRCILNILLVKAVKKVYIVQTLEIMLEIVASQHGQGNQRLNLECASPIHANNYVQKCISAKIHPSTENDKIC